MKPERLKKIKEVVSNRQLDLAVVLENVHDPHNVSAVVRTCDAIGICDVFLLHTDPRLKDVDFNIGKKSSGGSGKWIRVHQYYEHNQCFETLRQRYGRILGTHVDNDALEIYSVDFRESAAIIFGNEHEGLSKDTIKELDTAICVPQVGMVQSLNISVACAVTLYEAFRQRRQEFLKDTDVMKEGELKARDKLLAHYLRIQQEKKHFTQD
ncbi:MAG: RNA methyltransferase [Saprospiraceae bacterium]|nr:RNA methyltransferase [Saprospiraceae bacterium]